MKFKDVIQKYNQKALASEKHPRDVYREPSALIVICANAEYGVYNRFRGKDYTCWLFKRLKNSRFDFKQGDVFLHGDIFNLCINSFAWESPFH